MIFRIQSSQPEIDLTSSSSSSPASSGANAETARGGPNRAACSDLSAAPEPFSADLPIRQDRVDALRAQIEAGTYKVNAHAVTNAMLQNLFRS